MQRACRASAKGRRGARESNSNVDRVVRGSTTLAGLLDDGESGAQSTQALSPCHNDRGTGQPI